MYKLVKPGRLFFAIGIIALGILSFVMGDLIIGRPPEWKSAIPGQLVVAYVGGAVLILAGLAIIFDRAGGEAALIAGLIILAFSFLLRHVPSLLSGTWDNVLWSLNVYKTLALCGGTFIVAASFFEEQGGRIHRFVSNKNLITTGTIFMSIFLIDAGACHFKYGSFVIDYIPAYIPFHGFWAYFCGVALIAGGMGILVKETRRLAAFLSGIMILGWFFLLHIPRFVTAPNDPGERMGLCESLAISGVLFVLAGLFSKKQ